MICRKCGNPINSISDYGRPYVCRLCENEYQAEYRAQNRNKVNKISRESMESRRWLNGADNRKDYV